MGGFNVSQFPGRINASVSTSGGQLSSSTDLSGNSRLLVEDHFNETNFDAFNRLRVSDPVTIFDGKQVYAENILDYTTSSAGGAEREYIQSASKVVLRVSGSANDRFVYQTKRYFNYQPGKSQLIFTTFNLSGSQSKIDKCAGYYDNNNGIFLCLSGTNVFLVERSNVSGVVVDNPISQSNWNLDTLDGNGRSKVTLDLSKTEILFTDIEWLGVGSVKMGFVIDGVLRPAHAFHHANMLEDIYMQTPNLPVRWEIKATEAAGASSEMAAICATVISEGGRKDQGQIFTADRGTTSTAVANAQEPLMSIRLNSAHNRMTAVPESFSILADANANFLWKLILNPTISDRSVAVWKSVSGSGVEYDITMSGSVSNGTTLLSGYLANSSKAGDVLINTEKLTSLASDYDGTQDILVLTLEKLTAGAVNVYNSITWNEIK